MFRILFNLIHNAVGVARAVGTPRRIALALEQNAATVTLRVADDGPGLPDEVRKMAVPTQPLGCRRQRLWAFDRARAFGAQRAALKLSDRVRGTEFTIELQGADPADRQIAKARRPQRVE
jgi:signal transduction histidine kinase